MAHFESSLRRLQLKDGNPYYEYSAALAALMVLCRQNHEIAKAIDCADIAGEDTRQLQRTLLRNLALAKRQQKHLVNIGLAKPYKRYGKHWRLPSGA